MFQVHLTCTYTHVYVVATSVIVDKKPLANALEMSITDHVRINMCGKLLE